MYIFVIISSVIALCIYGVIMQWHASRSRENRCNPGYNKREKGNSFISFHALQL